VVIVCEAVALEGEGGDGLEAEGFGADQGAGGAGEIGADEGGEPTLA